MVRPWLIAAACLALAACSVDPPRRTVSRPRAPVAGSSNAAPVAASRVDGDRYTVLRGDTLYSIAFRNQLDFHDLADWNGIGRDYAIRVGQVLRLTPPGSVAPISASEASPPSAAVSPLPRPAARPPSPSPQSQSLPPVAASPGLAPPASPTPAPPRASSPPLRRADDGGWEWPTRGKVVRRFGDDPSAKGIDITGDRGQIVIASRAGKVVYSGTALKGYGELIIIKHDEQYLSAYGYNRRRLVEEGDSVAAGQPIAEMGDGPEQRPLLHYEIREKGRPIDPATLLPPR